MTPGQAANPILQFVPAILIFLIFYFLLIKPQKDKQKQHTQMLEKLSKNDQIVTIGGIHGTVSAVKEKTVVVRIADNIKIEIDREAVSTVTKSTS